MGDERSHMLGVRANAWLGVDPQLTQRSAAIALLLVHYDPGQYFHGQCVSGDERERTSVIEGTVAELFDVFVEVCCHT